MNQFKVISLFLFGFSVAYANITGTVYKDFNLNGIKDGGDAPVVAASIAALCEDGSTPSATTDANGQYTIIVATPGNKCRVEANVSSAGLGAGSNASGASSPLVDIVSDGSTHDISAASPATYCQANPDVVMAALPGHYLENSTFKAPNNTFGTLFKVPAPANGTFNDNATIDAKRTTLTTLSDTGAVWGVAWQKSTKNIFLSAALKRYVSLKDESSAAATQASAGTIYKVTQTGTVSSFAVVPNVLSATAATELINRDQTLNHDKNILKYTGRQGLGDIDISEDETKLYVVNLNTKELVTIDANTGNILSSTAITNPYAGGECSAANVRPWALKVRGTDVFIGSVCEDKVENDVGAVIQKYDGTTFTTIAKTNSLQYLRARVYGPTNKPQDDGLRYKNWTYAYSGGPILTDIEFDNDGNLVLGYTSRKAYNRYSSLQGDIRKMCLNPDGSYTDESSDVAPTTCATHDVIYSGNPTVYHEFYIGDFFGANHGEGHPETATGALAQAPGASNIIVGMVDATDWYQPGAIGNYDNTSGDKIGAQAVIKKDKIANGGEREPYGAKAGGMGDVELLCDPAPIEIGNYVWEDSNQNGIQDPGEPPLAGVPVKLYDNAGTLLGTATTDANGHYYFGGINNANSVTIAANTSYELRIAQADVNNKAPTPANQGTNDGIDNDATAVGANNVITFTTGVNNDHSLDFGIQPALACTQGTLFEDTNGNGVQDAGDTLAPAGITVIITDKYGATHTATTDANGFYQITGVPTGSVTVAVDTTDTDIPSGALWTNATATATLVESDPSGAPAACAVQPFPYTLPAPTAQDPKDVASCAKPTSLTWEGATVSSASSWTTMLNNTNLASAKAFTTVGGTTVGVKMYVNDVNGKFYDTDAVNNSGSGTSATAAFGVPYLTLYLGNQANPGNGTYSDAANCAANGYALQAGDKAELVVEFDQPVILDNWRIRDVDSGDIRNGVADWEWQDGIVATAEDANGNPVTIETKIGSSGVGLIKDANGIVHTDKNAYDAGGGDFVTGVGTTPNATNGHIVLTSNFVPVKKITITHVAGPDVPCQTRSALAMAGFAVCAPLHISGKVFDDADGVKPNNTCDTSNNKVDGTPISDINGTKLHACLLESTGLVVDTQDINSSGEYDFDSFIHPNTNYKVLLTEDNCTKGEIAPTATLSKDWYYEGEQIDPANNAGHDGTVDGTLDVNITDASVAEVDFAINKRPTAQPFTRPTQLNPQGTTQVPFDPTGQGNINAFITDNEETNPTRIKIGDIPASLTVYYQGQAITSGQVIDNPVITDFMIDPKDGDVDGGFSYVSMDKSCRKSEPALLKASFSEPSISGYLYLDNNNNGQVDGNATAKSCDASTPLFVNLIDSTTNKVISSVELSADGSYEFHHADVQQNRGYDLVLSQIQANTGDLAPSTALPAGCMATGENAGNTANNPENTAPNGKIHVDLKGADIPELNFGITPSVKIGDLVWIEDDNDGDPTTGTITYPPVGTVVTATDANGNTYTGVTDANGNYNIEVPASATYKVTVGQPAGTSPTLGSTDSSITDATSENNKSHNHTGTTVQVGTVDNLTVDFGFVKTAAIGNLFWIDSNGNGKVDGAEKGYNGVTVELYDANGTKLATQTTRNGPDGEPGYYLFDKLTPGKAYKVHFDYSNVPALKDYVYSPKAGGNNSNNADTKGFTLTVTPQAGEHILTLDAGINCGCANAPIKANGGDALGIVSMLIMMLMTFMTALFFVRKEEQSA
jgi:hypothetical protein